MDFTPATIREPVHAGIRILCVGSQPDQKRAGGVITHMRILRTLKALGHLDLFDVGSLHGTAALEGRLRLLRILANIRALRRKTVRTSYDLVMLHQPITAAALVKLGLILLALPHSVARKSLVFFHGGRFERVSALRRSPVRRLLRHVFGRARRFYFLSRPEFDGFRNTLGDLPGAYFRNFSESDDLLEHVPDANSLRLLYVGRIVQVKGVFDIVEATRLLLGRFPHAVSTTFVGDGPDIEALKQAGADIAGLQFTGYLDGEELERAYATADIFLLPTGHPEGFPYVIIEAMRAGLPVISTSEGALSELVEDGKNGFRIPFEDPAALADAIQALAGKSKREDISKNNRERFTSSLSRSQAESFYAELVAREMEAPLKAV